MLKLKFDVVLDLYLIVCLASLPTSHDHHTFHSTRKIDVTHKIIRTYVCTKQTYYALCRVVGIATMVLWYSFFLSLTTTTLAGNKRKRIGKIPGNGKETEKIQNPYRVSTEPAHFSGGSGMAQEWHDGLVFFSLSKAGFRLACLL